MKKSPSFALALALWSMLANPLLAESRTCRLIFPERPQGAPTNAYLHDGSKIHAVGLPSMNFSDVIELPAGELKLALSATEIGDAAQIPAEAPKLLVPADAKDFYIVIRPDPENASLPIRMEMVDAGEGKLKVGETMWCNFTEHRIMAKLGELELSVDPMARVVSKPPLAASGYYKASFSYQAMGDGDTKPITEQSWWFDANSKHIGFISYTDGKLPKIYFFRDFRIPKE